MRVDKARHQNMVSKTIVEAMGMRIEPGPQAFGIANLNDPVAAHGDRTRHGKGRVHGMNGAGRVDDNFLHDGFYFAFVMKRNAFMDEMYKRDILWAISFPAGALIARFGGERGELQLMRPARAVLAVKIVERVDNLYRIDYRIGVLQSTRQRAGAG